MENEKMQERINVLLKAKNLTARQFAEEIGIQPSGMSHILSGRNNPSLDFVMKVINRWPEININWLMFGRGEMYEGMSVDKEEEDAVAEEEPETLPPPAEPVAYDLFSQPALPPVAPKRTQPAPQAMPQDAVVPALPPTQARSSTTYVTATNEAAPAIEGNSHRQEMNVQPPQVEAQHEVSHNEEKQKAGKGRKRIVKFVVLYDDHSFAEYYPEAEE